MAAKVRRYFEFYQPTAHAGCQLRGTRTSVVAVFGSSSDESVPNYIYEISAPEINNTLGVTRLCPDRSVKVAIFTCDPYIATINSFISPVVGRHPHREPSHRTLEKHSASEKGTLPSQQFLAFGLVNASQARINSACAGALESAVNRLPLVA
jgi:hypothetical protein